MQVDAWGRARSWVASDTRNIVVAQALENTYSVEEGHAGEGEGSMKVQAGDGRACED